MSAVRWSWGNSSVPGLQLKIAIHGAKSQVSSRRKLVKKMLTAGMVSSQITKHANSIRRECGGRKGLTVQILTGEVREPHLKLLWSGWARHVVVFVRDMLFSSVPTYRLIRALSRTANQLAERDTELVIEGFPRSANTFSEVALLVSQGPDFKVAHHGHYPVHVKHALALGKPCVVLIREPASAIASLIDLGTPDDIGQLCDRYFFYYNYVLTIMDKVLIWDFEAVTENFPAQIETLNQRFAMRLNVPPAKEVSQHEIYSIADGLRGYTHKESPQNDAVLKNRRLSNLRSHRELINANPKFERCYRVFHQVMTERHRQKHQ